MTPERREFINGLLEHYQPTDAQDVQEMLKDLLGDTLQGMLEAEMDQKLGYSKYDYQNKETDDSRNGYSHKTVTSSMGDIDLDIPRDRRGEFEPQIVKKHQTDISNIEDQVLSMYAKGMTTRDISTHLSNVYGVDASAEMISHMTDRILPIAKEWQNRPLEKKYAIVFMDAIHFHVQEDNRTVKKAVYVAIGIRLSGQKEVLGMWIGGNESAKYWLGVLNEIKNRGVEDIMIVSVDGYQWSGFRVADPAVIGHYTRLLDQLKIPYAWQVEGRTLAGSRINPSLETLATPMFRGKQAHENDGGYYYWQHFQYQGVFSDMAARNRPYGGIFAKHRPIYTDHGVFIHYDPEGVTDMADGARKLVANFRYSKGPSTRHTGPSTLFRYLYQAGYDWLGAEQMYGPEEIILSSLRGASRAYSRPLYGTLHAMQWGSGPFTDPKHSLRLYMSLAVAYMHGSSHMNTEEALWTDEYMNDRYSVSGKEHLFAQHQMLDFVETHSRRGDLRSNVAVIQGRNDAWKSFGRGSLWSQKGDKWKFNKACESFDLLNVFYPDNIVDGCGPEGWFTSTPYGTVDLLPVEAPQDVMDRYKAMIFLGWNSYDANDFLRIRDFVFKGGTLLLTAAHLNEELQPDQPVRFPADDAVIREMLGENYRQLTTKTEIACGSGKIIYFPQKAYPAEMMLKADYVEAMKEIAAKAAGEETCQGWMEAAPSVGFTVWDHSDRRTIYLLNTDWASDQDQRPATFIYKGKKFPVVVRRYHIETIHCADGLAVMPASNTTDILSVCKRENGWVIKVQTTGNDVVQCMNAVTGKVEPIKFDEPGVHEVFVNE